MNNTKTVLKVINIIQLVGFIIYGFTQLKYEITLLQGFIDLGIFTMIGLVIFACIKGFSDIIDLLDNINNKIGN